MRRSHSRDGLTSRSAELIRNKDAISVPAGRDSRTIEWTIYAVRACYTVIFIAECCQQDNIAERSDETHSILDR